MRAKPKACLTSCKSYLFTAIASLEDSISLLHPNQETWEIDRVRQLQSALKELIATLIMLAESAQANPPPSE